MTEVVVIGMTTSAGVESTARSAMEHGYNVLIATDVVADRDAAVHEHSIQRVFLRIGRTSTAAAIFAALG